jgi:hypothetical protein
MSSELIQRITQLLQNNKNKETISFKWIKDKLNDIHGCNYS